MKRIPSFLAAFYFLTCLPLPGKKVSLQEIARGMWAFPFISLFIGLFLFFLAKLGILFLPPLLVPGILLCAWVWITGGLHLDGYIDCCDALLASVSKEKRLEILKDVAAGSFGVTGIVILLLLKFTAMASIPVMLLPYIPVMSVLSGRFGMLYVMFRFPYARREGLGLIFKESVKVRHLLFSAFVLLGAPLGFYFLSFPFYTFYTGFILTGITIVWCEIFGFWVLRRIPGFTGDVYGATCELTELLSLIIAAAMVRGGV